APVAYEHDWQPKEADVVTDLLVRPGVDKRRDTVNPGSHPRSSQTRSHRDHVLLGDAGVDETTAQGLAQGLQGPVSQVPGQEHKLRASSCFDQGLAEGVSHVCS